MHHKQKKPEFKSTNVLRGEMKLGQRQNSGNGSHLYLQIVGEVGVERLVLEPCFKTVLFSS